MNAVLSLAMAGLALAYIMRMERLQYFRNGVTFVAQNAVGAAASVYCTWDVQTNGATVVHVLLAIMAGLYLLRSRETYQCEISRPMELEAHDLTTIYGRGQR